MHTENLVFFVLALCGLAFTVAVRALLGRLYAADGDDDDGDADAIMEAKRDFFAGDFAVGLVGEERGVEMRVLLLFGSSIVSEECGFEFSNGFVCILPSTFACMTVLRVFDGVAYFCGGPASHFSTLDCSAGGNLSCWFFEVSAALPRLG